MPVNIPIRALLALCDPFQNPWTGQPFTVAEVLVELQQGKLRAEPFRREARWSRQSHIRRIAFLVKHGWESPVEVDVGVPRLGCVVRWPVMDGNHRLCAALVRGDEFISASVSGAVDYAFELFGVDIAEPEPSCQAIAA